MLEEALRSPTFQPAEAAQSLQSFVRFELQDGGASAEKRFIGLFSLLCERLYGPRGNAKEGFRHQTGGWLSRQSRWDFPRAQSNHHLHHQASPSLDMDPVVQLLAGIESLKSKEKLPTFLEAIAGKTEARRGVRIQYPFQALPRPTQALFLKIVQSVVDGSVVDESTRHNAHRLISTLFRVPPRDQLELRRIVASKKEHVERGRPLSLSPGAQSPLFRSSNAPTKPSTATVVETPQIMLSMLEYFLVSFIRYPLASPAPTIPAPQGHQNAYSGVMRHPKVTPYGEMVYYHLFKCYLLHYLPGIPQEKIFLGFPALAMENEVFLRILIEFWLCGNMEPVPVRKAAEAIMERRKKSGDLSVIVDLDSAFDLVQVKYEPQPVLVQRCIKNLVAHVLRDPNVTPAVMDCSNVASNRDFDHLLPLPWCLSPSMTVLQQPFYNYVLASFRHAPIHVAASPFNTALEAWLLWLEPWNVEIRRKHGPTDFAHAGSVLSNTVSHMSHSNPPKPEIVHVLQTMKPGAKSKYSQKWEPFVAANLHLYTVPLALFLRRARELDFSSNSFSRSVVLIQRVFRVYSPDLVNTINEIHAQGSQHSMSSLVETHGKNLGAYSPDLIGQTRLTSLQTDMRNFLEEVEMQHRKTVSERGFLDRLEAKIEGTLSYFGLVEGSTGEERKIHQLLEKARLIAKLPSDYQIMAPEGDVNSPNSNIGYNSNQTQAVKVNGVLTEHGKMQLITGAITCKPSDLSYSTDSLHGSVQSHEVAWLVPLTIRASEYLNSRMGLEGTKLALRINLRILADYRNLLVLVVTLWLWLRLLRF